MSTLNGFIRRTEHLRSRRLGDHVLPVRHPVRAGRRRSSQSKKKPRRLRPFTGIETLEDRSVPSATLSGFVYTDANNNGIIDAGDTGTPGKTVLLNNPAGTTVASTTTYADGSYVFAIPDVPGQAGSATVGTTINLQSLNASAAPGTVAQFNPALGKLTSVEIIDNSQMNSMVKVQNDSPSSDTLTIGVSGNLTLQGAGFSPINIALSKTDTANVGADTGTGPVGSATNPINFTGVNSHDFGTEQLSGSKTVILDGNTTDLSAFVGTSNLNLSLSGKGSTALTAGSDGVLQYGTSGDANVEIIYNYQSPPTFSAGIYTVVQPGDSDGALHGRPVDGRQYHADCQQLRQEFHPRHTEQWRQGDRLQLRPDSAGFDQRRRLSRWQRQRRERWQRVGSRRRAVDADRYQ